MTQLKGNNDIKEEWLQGQPNKVSFDYGLMLTGDVKALCALE
jgi:hypothetical protein